MAANAQFRGGVDDGTHFSQTSNQLLGRNIFLGGIDDGTSFGLAASQPFGRNIFLGGIDDGTSFGLAANQPFGRNIFLGGIDDGAALSLTTGQPFGRNIFLGGIDDGSNSSQVPAQPLGRNIFPGGGNDGWAIAFKSKDDTPLPVTLTDFSGHWQQNDALLLWQTATEVNTSHFELERSFDGNTFAPIQRIAAAGQSTSPKNYQYTDVAVNTLLPAGAAYAYYRLRSVDINGAATYSGVVVLQATRSSKIEYAVFPNPAQDVVTITATALPATGGAYIRLVDVTGKVLLLQKMTSDRQQISVSAFVDGLYFLQLMAADKVVYTQRIIISK
ncbi:T9SS type A sorting domain-containing protein [Hymenobacter negativus]|uniref:T9SS type A sorting domain-containing protein n=1 Tax=Hymenobacter negativus TaxID=2795026 RepID=A0ABS3QFU2_9BACT|nr:T9SS type A sorting domain-containing protein [Hymenobacter negativus]MBO2010121.1 T9SS type A sorting domain-containing protein [Hymenobacter negativus]